MLLGDGKTYFTQFLTVGFQLSIYLNDGKL